MRHTILILAAASSLAGCGTVAPKTDLARGVEAVNVPVVTRQDYAFDAAAPDGQLSDLDAARLDGWFRGMGLGYGDNVYVEGSDSGARADVARLAGRYGLLVADGGPVLPGGIAPGVVRIIVSRTRASVPNCPNWSRPAQPNYNNDSMSNFGCAVNGNLAAMIANPQDLIHGRDGSALSDSRTSTKAVDYYRNSTPTGSKGLQDVSTKGK
ncbi:MAG: CpaD family pilus assembly protein [Sphingomicrobium sp.]